MSSKTRRVPLIDAGRGLAALLVLEHHVMVYFGDRLANLLGPTAPLMALLHFLSNLNSAAVQLFFFLSGLSIYLAVDHARAATGRIDWGIFAWHRCRRILPLYWFALLWSWLLFVPLGDGTETASFANLAGNVAFLQTPAVTNGWFVPYAANGPLWSLAYEAWYYVATPLLCRPLFAGQESKRTRGLALLTAALAIAVAALAANKAVFTPVAIYATMWPLWIAGFAYAIVRGKRTDEAAMLALTVLAWAGISTLHKLVGSDTLDALADGLGIAALAILVFVIWAVAPRPALASAAISRVVSALAYLGFGSYALYLLHYPLLRWLAAREADGVLVALIVATLVGMTPSLELRVQRFVKAIPSPRFTGLTAKS